MKRHVSRLSFLRCYDSNYMILNIMVMLNIGMMISTTMITYSNNLQEEHQAAYSSNVSCENSFEGLVPT